MISLWSCQSILSLSESFKWQLQHIFSLCDMHLFVLIEPRKNIWPHMALSWYYLMYLHIRLPVYLHLQILLNLLNQSNPKQQKSTIFVITGRNFSYILNTFSKGVGTLNFFRYFYIMISSICFINKKDTKKHIKIIQNYQKSYFVLFVHTYCVILKKNKIPLICKYNLK